MTEGSAKYAESRMRNRGNSPFLVKIATIDLKLATNIATTPRNVPQVENTAPCPRFPNQPANGRNLSLGATDVGNAGPWAQFHGQNLRLQIKSSASHCIHSQFSRAVLILRERRPYSSHSFSDTQLHPIPELWSTDWRGKRILRFRRNLQRAPRAAHMTASKQLKMGCRRCRHPKRRCAPRFSMEAKRTFSSVSPPYPDARGRWTRSSTP